MEPTVETPEVDADGDAAVSSESFERVSAGTGYSRNGEEGKLTAEVNFRVGADLTEACELYGEEVVYERYRRGVTKDLGNAIRGSINKHLEEDAPLEDIPDLVTEELNEWRPDITRRRPAKSVEEDIASKFEGLDEAKQAEIMQLLQQKLAAQGH